jgi:homoserine O-acetyltransferase/O-succinyltransferase
MGIFVFAPCNDHHLMEGYMAATVSPPSTRRTTSVADRLHPFTTEQGDILRQVDLAYETWGTLNPARDNAVLIIHALTGDSHATSHGPGDQPGWWESLVGPGKAVDTDRFFAICPNNLGSCYGSTGPSSINPETGEAYRLTFPMLTVRDLVAIQARLIEQLGITTLQAVIGGSLGGMQVLEWAAMYPERVRKAIPVAASGRFSAQGIAFNEIQRRVIMLDPAWDEGNYRENAAPATGLAIARMVGVITYQSDELMAARFGRNPDARYTNWPAFLQRYDVEGYLNYQGDKLARRFDPNSYLYLTRAMDSHDLGRDRGSYEDGIRRVEAPTLMVGIRSDILFPTYLVREVIEIQQHLGRDGRYVEIDSPNGHDAFLNDVSTLAQCVSEFLKE